ncbi:MAG: glutathione S-transferase family protein [Maricaulaceae bacterium]
MTTPLTLYGVKISMFTGKARSYLIKQGIPFHEVAPVSEHYQNKVLPQLGRRIIPVIEFEDGTLVQDTSDIIDYFEAQGPQPQPAYPGDTLQHLLSLVLELFGDEGLIRPAMHYRWNYDDKTDRFITHGFGGWQGPDASNDAKALIKQTMGKFSGYLPPLGITPETIPEVERAYVELLSVLETHFARTPYLLGAKSTLGDYGMMCSLYAHLGRDPVPAGIMKNHSPSTFRWTERMNVAHDDISDMPYYKPSEDLPETLGALFKYIADYFLPELEMNVETLNGMEAGKHGSLASIHPKMSVLGFGKFRHGDVDISCAVRPMRFYMLQRVTDYFSQMGEKEQKRAQDYLAPSGLAPLLTLTAKHRIMRENFQEVWA